MSRKATEHEAEGAKESFTGSTVLIKVNSADDCGKTSIQHSLSSRGG